MQTPARLQFTIGLLGAGLLVSCAIEKDGPHLTAASRRPHRIEKVRTTAYSGGEGSGHRNAGGVKLGSGRRVESAASDWSRYPLGTRFQIVGTKGVFEIDDYGSALVGTDTIDLHKPNRAAIRHWGVRRVDIDVLQWGSDEQSLKVLRPRRRVPIVKRMIAALEAKNRTALPLRPF